MTTPHMIFGSNGSGGSPAVQVFAKDPRTGGIVEKTKKMVSKRYLPLFDSMDLSTYCVCAVTGI